MITTNKNALRCALADWFLAARAGETLGARETAALTVHEAAAQSSDYLYELLVTHSADEVALELAKNPAPADLLKVFLDANPELWTGMEGTPLEIALQIMTRELAPITDDPFAE